MRLAEAGGAGPRRVELGDVPFHAQRTRECGPAALAMVLGWSGLAADPDELAGQVYTPGRAGSLQVDLIGAARRRGRLAYPLRGARELLAEVAAGHPVLVLQKLGVPGYPAWHYAVVVGYDLEAGSVTLHSGRDAGRVTSASGFERSWQRAGQWGLVVLAPGRLPASAVEDRYLEAAAPLERAAQWGAAEAAYRAALDRWPQSLGGWLGLGNALYARGDLAGAEEALRAATRHHPDSAPALNNLAHVLAERGRRPEALAAIERALTLAGPDRAVYERTRAEIERAP